ncbi:helix-turn-helix domain-containing protein [Acidocella sp.]|uniref:helix-turn-helix domain-containing protein n=1 Tax=Acidocella sp. TaxID=50710 RepID=UPI00179FC83B|nr:helix-turn-helix domain-containing protein [Acidocella sp.]NNM56232.1 helix-turn-helix domain-containing protein [Acidocella sp.]
MTTATAEPNQTAEGGPRHLTPEEIGWMVKAFRTAHGWTQETLAELSGLQTRTIQRVEQGQPSSTDTRRAIGRALKFDDLDFFNTLKGPPTGEEMQKQREAFDREHLLLDARVVDGRQLLALMQDGPGFGAICAMSVADLPRSAQEAFAGIVDFVRDCMDIFDVAPQSELLGYGDTLDGSIAELKAAGFCLCAAFRDTKLTNDSWAEKMPLPCRITYLLAASKDKPPAKVAVARKVSGGF